MPTITRLYNFVDGTIAYADQVDDELNQIHNLVNGGLDSTNSAANAGYTGAQIASAPAGVDTTNINDDAVTAAKLRDSAVTDGDRAVTTDHIRNLAVNKSKLATAAGQKITSEQMGDIKEERAFSQVTVVGATDCIAIVSRITTGANFEAKIHYFLRAAGVAGSGTFNVVPAVAIPTATNDLVGLYVADELWVSGTGTLSGKVVFVYRPKT